MRHSADSITDDALDELYLRLERAEAAVAAVSVKAHEWAALAPADDWGDTPRDTVLADAGRYLIRLMTSSGAREASDASSGVRLDRSSPEKGPGWPSGGRTPSACPVASPEP